jgi:hypothetical protein
LRKEDIIIWPEEKEIFHPLALHNYDAPSRIQSHGRGAFEIGLSRGPRNQPAFETCDFKPPAQQA